MASDNLPARVDDTPPRQLSANAKLTSLTVDEMVRIAMAFSKAQVFKDKGNPLSAEALFVTILAGQEMGLGPSQAVMGISMIEGKPNISANLQAALLKAGGEYDYSVEWWDLNPIPVLYGKPAKSPHACKVTITKNDKFVGDTTFTILDAADADLTRPTRNGQPSNYVKYPRNMLFARAISNAVAFFAPDSTMVRTYHEGEVMGEPDAPVPELPQQPAPQAAVAPPSPQGDTQATPEPEEVVPDSEVELEQAAAQGEYAAEVAGEVRPGETPDEAMARMIAEEALEGYGEQAGREPLNPTVRVTFDPATEPAPAPVQPPTFMDPPEPAAPLRTEHEQGEPTVSAAQIRLIHVKCKEAGFTDKRRHQVLAEVTGTPHAERVPKSKMDDLLTRLNAEKEAMEADNAQG